MSRITVPKGGCGITGREASEIEAQSLGATVAICISDPVTSISAMAVPLLPSVNGIDTSRLSPACIDVASSLKKVFQDIKAAGADRKNLLIWLVGAGRFMEEPKELSLGVHLYAAAKKLLQKNGLPVRAEHVGGSFDRSVVLEAGAESLSVILSTGQEVSI